MSAIRRASCRCGQLAIQCEGDPVRISVCHCFACQRRTGAPFAEQARFPADKVTITGESREWVRIADSGNPVTYHFCPNCGSTVWYQGGPLPEAIAVPVGAFADPAFPPPRFSVWEDRRHPWLSVLGDEVEHSD